MCLCATNFFLSSSSSTSLLFGQRHITVSMNAVNVNRACVQFHKYIKYTDPLLFVIPNSKSSMVVDGFC